MSVLDKIYKDTSVVNEDSDKKTWCEEDNHYLFEFFTDFN